MEKEILEKIKQDISETKQWLETDLAEMEELKKIQLLQDMLA